MLSNLNDPSCLFIRLVILYSLLTIFQLQPKAGESDSKENEQPSETSTEESITTDAANPNTASTTTTTNTEQPKDQSSTVEEQ